MSDYTEQELLLILDFIRKCNIMTLDEMNKMKEQK